MLSGKESQFRKIGLMGASLATGNRGVSALAASIVGLISDVCPDAKVSLLIGNRDSKPFELRLAKRKHLIPVINYRLAFRSCFNEHYLWILLACALYRLIPVRPLRRWLARTTPWLAFVREADFVLDIRGGDSFSDIYGLFPFLIDGALIAATLLVRGEIGLLPQTYGPFKSRISKVIARYILRRASIVLARDRESLNTIKEIAGETVRAEFCPDVAFTLPVVKPAQDGIEPALRLEFDRSLVGINVNGLMFNGGYTRNNMFGLRLDYRAFLLGFAGRVLAESDAHLLFVPHTFAPPDSVESDPAACEELIRQLGPQYAERIHMVRLPLDQNEIKWVIGKCDFFVGSRMHACIAALSQGIPALGIAYSKKFRGVFDSIGVSGWVLDARDLEVSEAISLAMKKVQDRVNMRRDLLPRIERGKDRIHRVFESIFSMRKDVRRESRSENLHSLAAAGNLTSTPN